MKKETRILGFDDAPFKKFADKKTRIIGVFFRGGNFIDGVISADVAVDGNDSTAQITSLIEKSKFKSQTRAIMLDGIAVAGFNVIDVKKIFQATAVPVIVVMRKYPNLNKIKKALTKINQKEKISLLKKAGKIHNVGRIHIQICGLPLREAEEFLRISCTHSHIPEPIRVAHLIGQGLVFGESKGNA